MTTGALTQRLVHPDRAYLLAKRIFDITFTLLLVPLLCCVFIVIVLLIRLDSPGPIFFRQKRVGLYGAEFEMFKFRSMYHNCDDVIHRRAIERYMAGLTLHTADESCGASYKLHDDPRITRIGRFLRKMSLDELPQFINVLRGEMTLVGPRPALPYEVERYSSRSLLRLSGKPGLTGPWQVYGRSKVPFLTMIEMDIKYLQRQSIWQDLKLIVLTVPVMLLGAGGA